MREAIYFTFFLVSGFCSLVYEIVWLRLAMASVGVTTPLVSIVLSVFMAGLAVGSWGAGRLTARLAHSGTRTPLRLYALAETVIASCALLVPASFRLGRHVLTNDALGAVWDSRAYYAVSGSWVAATLLPACVAMGATFPLAMAAMRREPSAGGRTFSFLYAANVLGATAGTLSSAFVMIEVFGFRRTLMVAAALNVMLATAALVFSLRAARAVFTSSAEPSSVVGSPRAAPPTALVGLFLTGTLSLAFEVVWIRQLAPFLGTVVYSFATILAAYLAATFAGSWLSRTSAGTWPGAPVWCWPLVAVAALFPLVAADVRLDMPAIARTVLGIGPFCAAVGFLTPILVDRWSRDDPARAGAAYAVNVLGAIVGPLLAGFWLLQALGEHDALVVLAVPLLVMAALAAARPSLFTDVTTAPRGRGAVAIDLTAW